MIQSPLPYYLDRLQASNYKAGYLAFLRVAISVWLLKDLLINWSSFELLYGPSSFIVFKNDFLKTVPGAVALVRHHYHWIMYAYIGVLLLNIAGIGRWVTGLALFCLVYIIQSMNFALVNGGHIMARLLVLYLVFANSYQYFVLLPGKPGRRDQTKLLNLLSNLAALSMMLQLCLAYFSAGLAKWIDPTWRHGEAVYYVLQKERFMGTPLNQYLVQHDWITIPCNYAVLFFELGFPLLIWIKKLRPPLLLAGFLLHLSIYIFLMIYGFQFVFVMIYGLFLPDQQVRSVYEKLRLFFLRKPALQKSVP